MVIQLRGNLNAMHKLEHTDCKTDWNTTDFGANNIKILTIYKFMEVEKLSFKGWIIFSKK